MKPASWRAAILAACALTVTFSIADVLCVIGIGDAPPWSGLWGVLFASASEPFYYEVSDVAPGGAADRAGLRRGDLLDVRAMSLQERDWFALRSLNGHPVTVFLRREGAQKKAVIVPTPLRDSLYDLYGVFLSPSLAIWLSLFAALIAWRRSDVTGLRLLAGALVTLGLGLVLSSNSFLTPWAWLDFAMAATGHLLAGSALVLVVTYAGTFARPLSRVRRAAQWLCYVLVAVGVAVKLVEYLGVVTLWFDPQFLANNSPWIYLAPAASDAAAVACIVLALAASQGAEQQRAMWTLVPLGAFPAINEVTFVLGNLRLSYSGITIVSSIADALLFASPVALTYAALSRHLVDIGFVLNRAVVFTLVSTIVIGVFVLVEWAASAWLTNATHTTSALVGMIVALILGL